MALRSSRQGIVDASPVRGVGVYGRLLQGRPMVGDCAYGQQVMRAFSLTGSVCIDERQSCDGRPPTPVKTRTPTMMIVRDRRHPDCETSAARKTGSTSSPGSALREAAVRDDGSVAAGERNHP